MEVNDRQKKQIGGDDENTAKAQKLTIRHSQWLFTGSFFNELKCWGETFAHDLCLFFNKLKLCAKTAHGEFIF